VKLITMQGKLLILAVVFSICDTRTLGRHHLRRTHRGHKRHQIRAIHNETEQKTKLPVKSLKMVMDMLVDIRSSIEDEERTDAGNYKCFMEWCDKEVRETGTTIITMQRDGDSSEAASKELDATISSLDHALKGISEEIDEAKSIIDQATNVREEDNAKYTEEMNLNRQSISQVIQAIKIVQKVQKTGGFLQNGVLKRIQLNEPGESSYVLGIMKQLEENLQKNKKEMEGMEKQKASKHDTLMATKNTQIGAFRTEKSEKQQALMEAKVSLVEQSRTSTRAKKEAEDLTILLQETYSRCRARQAEWKVRGEDRSREKAALNEAMDYLESIEESPSFVQLKSKRRHHSKRHGSHFKRHQGPAIIDATDATAFLSAGSAGLVAELTNGKDGKGFDAAKKVVTDLMKVLDEEQKSEEKKYKYCRSELELKETENQTVTEEVAQLAATIERKNSQSEAMTMGIKEQEEIIAKLKESLAKAAALRGKQHADFMHFTIERKLAMKVTVQAVAVLNKFYATEDKTAFVVAANSATSAPPTLEWDKSTRKDVRSTGVVAMMLKIKEDLEQEQKDAEDQESQQAEEFTRFSDQMKIDVDEAHEEITEKTRQNAKLLVHIGIDKESKAQKVEDLGAIKDQLASLHKECDELLANFKQRTKARDFEVAQLRDVLDILSGASGTGIRTSLLQ